MPQALRAIKHSDSGTGGEEDEAQPAPPPGPLHCRTGSGSSSASSQCSPTLGPLGLHEGSSCLGSPQGSASLGRAPSQPLPAVGSAAGSASGSAGGSGAAPPPPRARAPRAANPFALGKAPAMVMHILQPAQQAQQQAQQSEQGQGHPGGAPAAQQPETAA